MINHITDGAKAEFSGIVSRAINRVSHLSNNRGGWNKRGGGVKVAKSINVEVGITVEVGIFLKNQ